ITTSDVKAPKVDISLPSVDIALPQASVDLQAPEATLSLEGDAKVPEKEPAKTKDGKFKMPKFGMPSFGWSSSREAKGTVAAEVDVSLKEPEVTVPSAAAEVDVTLPSADIQVPGVEAAVETAAGAAEGEKGRFKMPDVKMPSVKLPKVKAPHAQVSLPKAEVSLAKGQEGEVALQGPEAEASLEVAAGKAEGGGMKIHMPKVKVPSVVFSKPTLKAPKLDADVSLPQAELKAADADVSIAAPDVKLPSVSLPRAEVDLPSAAVTAAVEGSALGLKADVPGAKTEGAGWKLEKPSLKMPKADIKAPKVDISLPSVDVALPQASVDLQAPEAALTLEGEAKAPEKEAAKTKDGKFKMPKFGMPSFGWSSSREAKGTVAAEVDVSLKEPEVTVPSAAAEMDMTLPDSKLQTPSSDVPLDSSSFKEEEIGKSKTSAFRMPKISLSKTSKPLAQNQPGFHVSVSETLCPSLTGETSSLPCECVGSKPLLDVQGESVSKSAKFRVPSIGFSKAELTSSKIDQESSLQKGDITLTKYQIKLSESQSKPASLAEENLSDFEILNGEKAKTKKSQFSMPKISFPKIKGQKVQVSLTTLETDVSETKQKKEGVSVQKSEKESSGEGVGLGIKVPKVTVPTLEFSKPEAKSPKTEMDISMPTGDVTVSTCEIAVGDVEIKAEGSEGKTKMPKFQMPKVGITLSKGKGSEKDVGQSKSEVKVPQLKATVEISDIAVETPDLEVECGTESATYSAEAKITKTDSKASEADVHLPSADISIPKTDNDIQESDATVKIKGEIKQDGDGDGEEKEGHFKMPKFKLPSFSWSPKKEASVKPDSGANLEDQKHAVMSSRIDTEVKGTATYDQSSGPDLDLEISAGKVEQKSPLKKPQFVMPKISLSKIKVPKSQSHSPKVEANATLSKTEIEVEDSIKIPDIEKSHPEGTEEGAQISIKLADTMIHTLEFSKVETEASKTEITVSSAKTDASLAPSEGSFQPVDLKISSTNEGNIQKTGIKLPKGEASVDLKSPDIVTESSSVMDGSKVKLEGPEGKIKVPKFQKTKFGISLTKGKVPETEISSPKIEAELPQLKMTNEIADIAVGVPASELTSDMSDPGVVDDGIQKLGDSVESSDVSLPKMEGNISLSTEGTDRVNIPKTETYADIVKRSVEEHTSEITVSAAELSKSYPSASETDKDKSSANRITGETVDQTQGVPEVSVRIPKLKIPRFTFRTLPIEADVLLSKVVTDPKGSSTDIEI
ncbi:AHNK2 protein, partial [Hirundo rustica]|nr:AHNK2 protein [Hirundo rustica]